ncbi:hypothetical protein LC724_12410 [Blautia sp. RD014234]|nr:hypothetical protein [Blautia parvula]
MMQPENELLEAVWEKAERKEENLKLAGELSRMPRQEGLDSFCGRCSAEPVSGICMRI